MLKFGKEYGKRYIYIPIILTFCMKEDSFACTKGK
jgi:hypothetical protein